MAVQSVRRVRPRENGRHCLNIKFVTQNVGVQERRNFWLLLGKIGHQNLSENGMGSLARSGVTGTTVKGGQLCGYTNSVVMLYPGRSVPFLFRPIFPEILAQWWK